uniref:uncharacterized protein LOC122583991 n=1 Tax=Erigeron canadensis TaxID=72917 RepID=UPI001CB96A36|nr:uncharacterized protein LOC122583991 [Erigeron canadensis]
MEEIVTIDWNDSKFEKDEIYEHINAPQWLDFSNAANSLRRLHDDDVDDDDAWFCRPDCNHPKTADDIFVKIVPNHFKDQISDNVSQIPSLDDRNRSPFSKTKAKKTRNPLRKVTRITENVQDSENQNPNFLTQTDYLKSSIHRKKTDDSSTLKEETPRRLKSTFSARNLFAGKNILNQITDFCSELKKLATRKKEKIYEHHEKTTAQMKLEMGVLQEIEIQKKPLLEARKAKNEVMDKKPEAMAKKNLDIKNRSTTHPRIWEIGNTK